MHTNIFQCIGNTIPFISLKLFKTFPGILNGSPKFLNTGKVYYIVTTEREICGKKKK